MNRHGGKDYRKRHAEQQDKCQLQLHKSTRRNFQTLAPSEIAIQKTTESATADMGTWTEIPFGKFIARNVSTGLIKSHAGTVLETARIVDPRVRIDGSNFFLRQKRVILRQGRISQTPIHVSK